MKVFFTLVCFIFLSSCSSKSEKLISRAKKISETKGRQSLLLLDQAYSLSEGPKEKIRVLNEMENLIKSKIKKADLYQAVLEKKIYYLENEKIKDQTRLLLAQLYVQNLRSEEEALKVLSEIHSENLSSGEREQYYQLLLFAYINSKKLTQALLEANNILDRKDLSPSERFKVVILKARIYTELKKYKEAEVVYRSLMDKYHNLAKKWKVRSQLALTYESLKMYKEAVKELEAYLEEEGKEDTVVEWRIEELKKRIALQPGGKGRLRR